MVSEGSEMIPEPKFEVGELIWVPRAEPVEEFETCPDCLGERTWRAIAPAGDEVLIRCFTCTRGYETLGLVPVLRAVASVESHIIQGVEIKTDPRYGEPVTYTCALDCESATRHLIGESQAFARVCDAEAESERMAATLTAEMIAQGRVRDLDRIFDPRREIHAHPDEAQIQKLPCWARDYLRDLRTWLPPRLQP